MEQYLLGHQCRKLHILKKSNEVKPQKMHYVYQLRGLMMFSCQQDILSGKSQDKNQDKTKKQNNNKTR